MIDRSILRLCVSLLVFGVLSTSAIAAPAEPLGEIFPTSAPGAQASMAPTSGAKRGSPDNSNEQSTVAGCERTNAEIVVCGTRPSQYRLDPAIVEVERQAADTGRGSSPDQRKILDEKCRSVGFETCPGEDVIPVSQIALVAANAGMLALSGEDWKEAFRTRPDSYSLYRDSKAKVSKRPRVQVGVGIRP